MLLNLKNRVGATSLQLLIGATLALALAACGGGGGSPGSTSSGGGTGGAVGDPKISVALTDATGTATNTLSGGQKGTVKATVLDASGKIAAGEVVTFTTGDAAMLTFEQSSALTDEKGVAVTHVSPSSASAAGATTIIATTVIKTRTASATTNVAVGAAPLTIAKMEFAVAPPSPLPAFSTAALNITINSGGTPATSVTGLTLTSLCVADGTAKIVVGSLSGGVQTATYTNNGCLRVNDTITASIGNSSASVNLAVGAANIGTIQFVGTDLNGSSIVLKGSGGLGRKESALLTFRVIDQNNNGLAGVDVTFRATTYTGGLTVAPDKGTTDASGNVTTTVSSGTIPTPVRVIAEATRNGKLISGLSDALIVSTGLPIQKAMSLSFDSYNIEGLNYDGEVANATVRLADQYGNPISDGTAVNFVSEGGAIGSSLQGACTTSNGGCSVQLKSQNFRPANGRVSVLAYVQGIEDFTDANGDGQYTCTDWDNKKDGVPFRPLVDVCKTGAGEGWSDLSDPFLDAGDPGFVTGVPSNPGTFDGVYDPTKGDLPIPYGHALYSPKPDGHWGLNYIRAQAEVTFSGSVARIIRLNCGATCKDWDSTTDGPDTTIAGTAGTGCALAALNFRVVDANNNPMPAGTTIGVADANKLAPLTPAPSKVPSTSALGGTFHSIGVQPDSSCAKGYFSVVVTTPKGTATSMRFFSN
jgi:hypothetical protein